MDDTPRYEILNTLGKGGFGTVYRAREVGYGSTDRVVAVKVLTPTATGDSEVAMRLRDEGRLLQFLDHEGIVRVYRLVQLEGRWSIVMEYIEGTDLRSVIAVNRTVPPATAIEIIGRAAAALHHAFTVTGPDGGPLRLIHRDIKPSNIQITREGIAKVLDFGVARADFAEREAVTRSLAFGSLLYMSPERLDFVDSHAGDIYALGAVLFELVTGKVLGRTSSRLEKHSFLRNRALSLVRSHLGVAGRDVADLIGRMIAYEPDSRPDAGEVSQVCDTLIPSLGPLYFHEWAEVEVPRIRATRRPVPEGELAGTNLTTQEVDTTMPIADLPDPPHPSTLETDLDAFLANSRSPRARNSLDDVLRRNQGAGLATETIRQSDLDEPTVVTTVDVDEAIDSLDQTVPSAVVPPGPPSDDTHEVPEPPPLPPVRVDHEARPALDADVESVQVFSSSDLALLAQEAEGDDPPSKAMILAAFIAGSAVFLSLFIMVLLFVAAAVLLAI